MNSRIAWFLGITSLILWSDWVFAQTEFTLTPSLAIREYYDDNLFLRPKALGTKSDFITTVSPGILLNMRSIHRGLEFNYVPSIVRYSKYSENDTIRHSARVIYRENLSEHFRLDITDNYLKSEDPLEITPEIYGYRRNRNPYQRNSAEARGTYTFGPESTLKTGYRNSFLLNEDPTVNDGTIQEPFVDLTHWFDKNHGVGFNYRYTVGTYSRDVGPSQPDYTGHSPGVRYMHRFSPHTSAYLSYNYTERSFSQNGVNPTTFRDYTIHSWMVGFDKQLDPQTEVNGGVGYFFRDIDSANASSQGGFSYNTYLTKRFQRGNFTIGGKGGWDEQYLQAGVGTSGFVKYYSADANGQYFFLEKLSGYAGIMYRDNEYENNVKEQILRGNTGIRWAFHRYVSLNLDYSYAKRSSDNPLNEYEDNRLLLVLTGSKPYRF